MQFLVFSDSHGHAEGMARVIAADPGVRHVIFLGDGLADLSTLSRRFSTHHFRTVRGNMDFLTAGFDAPDEDVFELYGTRIFLCHGHTLGVKGGTATAEKRALQNGARVLLYGHTHVPEERYLPGKDLLILNPGSIGRPRDGAPSFAVLSILPDGKVAVSHGKLT